jgi:iron complex outermembrane receptor protein
MFPRHLRTFDDSTMTSQEHRSSFISIYDDETSWNLDLSYVFIPGTSFQFKTSLFFSRLKNAIQAVYGVDSLNSAIYQFQNTGDAQFYGWEAEFKWDPLSAMQTGLQSTFSFIP